MAWHAQSSYNTSTMKSTKTRLIVLAVIIAVLLIAVVAKNMADKLLEKGVYVIGFSYPVVPKGAARIRIQISAAHSRQDLDFAIAKIKEVKEDS